jgi:hypothetical protein
MKSKEVRKALQGDPHCADCEDLRAENARLREELDNRTNGKWSADQVELISLRGEKSGEGLLGTPVSVMAEPPRGETRMKTCKECPFKQECFWKAVPPQSMSFNGPEWNVLGRLLERLAMDVADACPHYEQPVPAREGGAT